MIPESTPPIQAATGVCLGAEKYRGRVPGYLLRGWLVDWPREVFLQIGESQVGRCIRTAKWKYSVFAPDRDGWKDSAGDRYVEEFLYDLEDDPHERNNRVTAPELAAVRAELAATLKRRMVEAGERAPAIEGNA